MSSRPANQSGYRIFYGQYYKADTWGEDLYAHLNDIYKNRAKYCPMIMSDHYAKSNWVTLERQAAQAKSFTQNMAYILPLRLDGTEIPGLNDTVAYIDFHTTGMDKVISLVRQKFGK
jgi:hypothetical protein